MPRRATATIVVGEIIAELGARVEWARAAGVARERIAIDPGVGFAKRSEHSLAVLRELPRFAELGLPVAVGVSRKRFIGEKEWREAARDRVDGTIAANVLALPAERASFGCTMSTTRAARSTWRGASAGRGRRV